MIEFELPDERLRPPAATGLTSLLGSLILPSERSKYFWSGGPPTEGASDVVSSSALARSPDPNLLSASGNDVAASENDLPPLKPSWQRAAEAIEAVMAQRAQGFPLDIAAPPRGPTVQEAQAKQAAAAIATAISAGGTAGAAGEGLAALAVRAAPALVAAGAATAPVVAAALPFLLIPTNSQSGTIDLGDGLRARFAPGQRTASIERRADNGLLGSGLGARWETLPVATTIGAGPDGRQTVFVDHGQLEWTIGAGAAADLLKKAGVAGASHPSGVPLPIIMEIRIGSSTDAGVTVSHREATREEVLGVCPNVAEYERIALKAAENARAAGLPNGLAYTHIYVVPIRVFVRILQPFGAAFSAAGRTDSRPLRAREASAVCGWILARATSAQFTEVQIHSGPGGLLFRQIRYRGASTYEDCEQRRVLSEESNHRGVEVQCALLVSRCLFARRVAHGSRARSPAIARLGSLYGQRPQADEILEADTVSLRRMTHGETKAPA